MLRELIQRPKKVFISLSCKVRKLVKGVQTLYIPGSLEVLFFGSFLCSMGVIHVQWELFMFSGCCVELFNYLLWKIQFSPVLNVFSMYISSFEKSLHYFIILFTIIKFYGKVYGKFYSSAMKPTYYLLTFYDICHHLWELL